MPSATLLTHFATVDLATEPSPEAFELPGRAILCLQNETRNSSGDEIANVNFLNDDIVQVRLVHKFRHRSTRLCVGTHVYQIQ